MSFMLEIALVLSRSFRSSGLSGKPSSIPLRRETRLNSTYIAATSHDHYQDSTQLQTLLRVDLWDRARWLKQLDIKNTDVVVCTPQILLNVVAHGYLSLENMDCIVLVSRNLALAFAFLALAKKLASIGRSTSLQKIRS